MVFDRRHDLIGATAAQLAGCRRARLDVEPAHGVPVVHGVEGGDFVNAHGGHFEDLGDFVHHAYACEAVLALAEVEEGHHGCFFVLGGVAFEDFGDELLVGGVEVEGDGGVVFGAVAVLEMGVSMCEWKCRVGNGRKRH